MDSIKGAIELRELLAPKNAAAVRVRGEAPAGALPLFAWVGVAPEEGEGPRS